MGYISGLATMTDKIHIIELDKIDLSTYKNQYTSCIILSQDKKIILQKRGDDFYTYPGYLCAFGGKVEPNETPLETIIRELKEELDVDIPASELVFISAYTEEISKHNDLVYGYFWHDNDNKVQTCYEGNIAYFDTVDNVFENKKLLDDVPFLLYKCNQENLIKNTG